MKDISTLKEQISRNKSLLVKGEGGSDYKYVKRTIPTGTYVMKYVSIDDTDDFAESLMIYKGYFIYKNGIVTQQNDVQPANLIEYYDPITKKMYNRVAEAFETILKELDWLHDPI